MKALGTARGFRLALAGALAVVLLRAGMVGLVLPPLHGGSPGAAAPAHEVKPPARHRGRPHGAGPGKRARAGGPAAASPAAAPPAAGAAAEASGASAAGAAKGAARGAAAEGGGAGAGGPDLGGEVDRGEVWRLLRDIGFPAAPCTGEAGKWKVLLASEYVTGAGGQGRVDVLNEKDHASHLSLAPELVGTFPEEDYGVGGRRCHDTCALVGNSGTVLRSGWGPEIDAHDAVMRINIAPFQGFQQDVGRKTTYDFSNRENARKLLQRRSVRWRDPKSDLLFFEINSPVNRAKIFGPLAKKYGKANPIRFVHPTFVSRSMKLWHALKQSLERQNGKEYHDKPMSGFYAVLFMAQICRRLDMYGFEAYTKRSKTYPYHYFDAVQGVTTAHSFDMALDMFKALGGVFDITVKEAGKA